VEEKEEVGRRWEDGDVIWSVTPRRRRREDGGKTAVLLGW
jgi:hypothetical protein